MRLDKFICDCTGMSRRHATFALRDKRICVNGVITTSGKLKLNADDSVELDYSPLILAEHLYLMLNKPAGYVCANSDSDHPTVLDLIGLEDLAIQRHHQLQIVGRLDIDTTGLLLITTDGDWNHRITAPKGTCSKTYAVELAEPIVDEHIKYLEQGVMLRSEPKPTLPCKITKKSDTQLDITLNEGRYHQVKRMFAAVNNKVTKLHRWKVGGLVLENELIPGEFRPLSQTEIKYF